MPLPHSVLIVGVGSIGERHVRCFQKTGRAEISICEVDDRLRDRIASSYNISDEYATLEDALREKHSAVLIATPADLHIPIARQCADAQLHMLIEKPLALTLNGIDQLQNTINENKLVACVAYVWRSNPILIQMKQALDSGKFGQPVNIYLVMGEHFPTSRPAYRNIYYKSRSSGGGAIQDALPHGLNLGEWLVGPTTHLFADADHLQLDGVDVEDTVHVVARHGKIMASYSLNQHQAPSDISVTVVCTHGTLRFEAHHNRWRWMIEPHSEWTDEVISDLHRDDSFIAQANMFLDAIEGKSVPACSLDQGAQTLKAIQSILSSCDAPAWNIV